ncbi:MAG: lysophospholipid acyltransferase family protein [Clostridia bacterium]|nr:lysophospholipid acyltransferase family protein [Clostridia bacterium]
MKLIRNIPNGYKLFRSVSIFNNYLNDINKLRDAGEKEEERALIAKAVKQWIDNVFDIFDVTCNIKGQENIPMDRPCVFIANHQGYADIIVMLKAAEGKQIGFVAKDALQKLPYFGKWIKALHGVFIQRGDAKAALRSIQVGVNELKNGYSMVIFPEGTRSHCHDMGEFKAGSFKLATKAKVPVVPVTIDGSYHMFEEREIISSGATVNMIIHEPIETADMDRHEAAELPERVEKIIRDGLKEFE